jgi:peptide/nickel transport system permease protein
MSLIGFVFRRIVFSVPLLFGITLVAFVIANAIPSDPVSANLSQSAMANPEIVAAFRAEWGLDKPLYEQYVIYLRNLLHGNLGKSIKTRRPVAEDIKQYLPATLELATTALVLGVLLGMSGGVASAVRRNRPIDYVVRTVTVLGVSVPVFLSALLALLIFHNRLGWAAGPGRLDFAIKDPPTRTGLLLVDSGLSGDWPIFRNAVSHLILPSLVLGLYVSGIITRVTRSSMLDILDKDYMRTARAKGLRARAVILWHALPNALIPVVTVIGLSYGQLLAGAVLTESIFAWPGIGRYLFRASTSQDFPAIMGVSILIAVIYLIVNLVVDVLYFYLNPQIRYE